MNEDFTDEMRALIATHADADRIQREFDALATP